MACCIIIAQSFHTVDDHLMNIRMQVAENCQCIEMSEEKSLLDSSVKKPEENINITLSSV